MILVIDYVSNEPIDCFWQVPTDKKWLYGKNDNTTMIIIVARVSPLACANDHLLRTMDSLVAVQ